jgi:hypothetical protein
MIFKSKFNLKTYNILICYVLLDFVARVQGLRWLSSQGHILFWQRTWTWLSEPTSSGLQLCVIPAAENPMPSLDYGEHCTQMHPPPTDTWAHIIKNNKSLKKFFKNEGTKELQGNNFSSHFSGSEGLSTCLARVYSISPFTEQSLQKLRSASMVQVQGTFTTSLNAWNFTSFEWRTRNVVLNKSQGSASAQTTNYSSSSCSTGIIYKMQLWQTRPLSRAQVQTLQLVCCGQTSRATRTSCGFWKENRGHDVLAKARASVYFWNHPLEPWRGEGFAFYIHSEPRTGDTNLRAFRFH